MRKFLSFLLVIGASVAVVRGIVLPWSRTWGRRTEDDGPLPGDDLVSETTAIETRGIDIAAPPERVWPWLAQMGYGRAGWYSYDALDMNQPSAGALDPALGEVAVGDVMPTHPGGGFVVRVADPPHALVLYSDTELVRRQAEEAQRDESGAGPVNIKATGAFLETAQPAEFTASWAFVVEPRPNGTSRLIERFRVRFGPDDRPWLGVTMPVVGFGVFLMMRKQMLGIRERVERSIGAPMPVAA
jgi:hypothetical protein